MRVSDLDYDLPEELIAQEPLAKRDASRLLLLDVAADDVEDRLFTELPGLLPPSLFVFNDTRVFPARLLGHKATGGRVELLLLRRNPEVSDRWLAMGRSSKGLRAGMELSLCDSRLTARIVREVGHGQLEVDLRAEGDVDALIEQVGDVPLPPYIRRAAGDADRARYQTVYARKSGAVAAPTAGLHFTQNTLSALEEAGHQTAYVTLHVGPGTFRPVQVDTLDEHEMHEEAFEVSAATVAAIGRARVEGRPVVAVGTTVVRTLESSVDADGNPVEGFDTTRLFIRPPHRFHVVDHLVTNFHLPRSTLLALVMAFAGVDLTRRAYREAAERRYRFYSYGDAMLIRGSAR
ncbi:MAG: tRNA preQ1(34) S-adenosylmethionine ribosyltransferase-isomerase QueA [Deltaproteobacteria bacterium]|nr:tRNA preQ1(34) S-adenosylmethionine ribosyltransferase-isomerase QueA [Deltaproteobacteria bacterium]MBW1874604.1 tRNA preQ1(34) S-adenosylmethionine ribosyltransferase-isomerase QueA [Deltaproteobacteria bacterium]MBW2209829.1 tRNA preQ1(34) S-adenosylmethionine ribosyltransferase-isomerase QueA [Deltaproteobacteria bacterium]MBW2213397.1 tRNA preQ1(34) S-adenosylmethionine ribosyltransferase-isomerase QueA [Deltaproteobacteria bacterium]MBW2378693.1 tRNA preQ1(34) S-adenosylmethionine ribo